MSKLTTLTTSIMLNLYKTIIAFSLVILLLAGCEEPAHKIQVYNGLEYTNHSLENINKNEFWDLEKWAALNPYENSHAFKVTDSVFNYSDSLYALIDTATKQFLIEEYNDSLHILTKEDISEEPPLDKDAFIDLLNEYKSTVLSLIEPSERNTFLIDSINSVLDMEEIAEANFSFIDLEIIKSKVHYVNYYFMQYQNALLGHNHFIPRKTIVKLQSYAEVIKPDEEFQAAVYVFDIDTLLQYKVILESDDGLDTLPIVNGMAVFSENTTGMKGEQKRKGYVEMETDFGQVKKLPFTIKYTVK